MMNSQPQLYQAVTPRQHPSGGQPAFQLPAPLNLNAAQVNCNLASFPLITPSPGVGGSFQFCNPMLPLSLSNLNLGLTPTNSSSPRIAPSPVAIQPVPSPAMLKTMTFPTMPSMPCAPLVPNMSLPLSGSFPNVMAGNLNTANLNTTNFQQTMGQNVGFPAMNTMNMNTMNTMNTMNSIPQNFAVNQPTKNTAGNFQVPAQTQNQSKLSSNSDGPPPSLPKQLSAVAEEPDNQYFDRQETMNNLLDSSPSLTVRTDPSPTPIATPPPNLSAPSFTHNNGRFRIESGGQFKPQFPARARLNVYVNQRITDDLHKKMTMKFKSAQQLYYYIDISTALQINDQEMEIYVVNGERVVFINYDLREAASGQILYGVIKPNTGHVKKSNNPNDPQKWLWNLDRFADAQYILNNFGIDQAYLPKSSRCRASFQEQLNLDPKIMQSLTYDIVKKVEKWNGSGPGSIQIIKRKPKKDSVTTVCKLSLSTFYNLCKESWDKFDAIPIVVNENKANKDNVGKHWIEWVKVIQIKHIYDEQWMSLGIACKYDEDFKQWNVRSVCLDKGDVENKHRLCALNESQRGVTNHYAQIFNSFITNFDDLQITEDTKDAQNKQNNQNNH